MNNVRLKISPPWVTYVNEIIALFDEDPQIAINYNDKKRSLVLATNNGNKAEALRRLLPWQKEFGNVILKIGIDGPTTNIAFPTNEDLFNTAFEGNPAFAYAISIEGILTNFTYVVFKNTVVQFFNDNLNDIHGIVSTLYQDIAAEIFEDANLFAVCYNTDIEHALGKPLGEWP